MLHWFCAQVRSGKTRLAIECLQQQNFITYSPIMTVVTTRNGRTIEQAEPVFPAYLFVSAEPNPHRWRAINNTRGVIRLLGNDQPCSLPDSEVEGLMEREKKGQLRHPHKRQIRQGDVVEFRCGSFVGLQGICQWTRRERIGVLLSILGGSTVTISPRDWLKLAEVA